MKKIGPVNLKNVINIPLLICISVVSLSGCGSAPLKALPEPNDISPGKANIIVYRPFNIINMVDVFTFEAKPVNSKHGEPMPMLWNNSFIQHEIAEGKYRLGYGNLGWAGTNVTKFVKARENYCFETGYRGILIYFKEVPLSVCEGVVKGGRISKYDPD